MSSFAQRMSHLAQSEPERVAVVCAGVAYSRSSISRHAMRLAGCLSALHVAPGARVGVVAKNSELHLVCALAISHLGAVMVPLHFRSAPLEARHNLEDSGCSVVIFDPESASAYAWATRSTSFVGVLDDTEGTCELPVGWVSLSALCRGLTALPRAVPVRDEDIAMIHYTSGSTGCSKGVCLTHGNIAASWDNWSRVLPIGDRDTVLTITPFAHVGGLQTFTLQVLLAGGTVIIQKHFDSDEALREIERYKVTLTFCVPRIYTMMSRSSEFEKRDLSSLRCAVVGGASVTPELVDLYLRRNVPLCPSWGMTETCGGATILRSEEVRSRPKSVGRPMAHVDLRLVDGAGREVGANSDGSLSIRGGSVAAGYWRDGKVVPLAEGEDGWFDTGDVAQVDDEGYLSITGRSSDRIISGGENIYPAELERAMGDLAGVMECAVIGVPDERWGESPVVFVVPQLGRDVPSLSEIRAHLGLRISRYKLPRELRVIDALPRTAQTGKVDRGALTSLYATSHDCGEKWTTGG